MLPVKMVYDLLMQDEGITNLVNPDMIFTLEVPEEYQKIDIAPIVRINEISDNPEDYASNQPFTVVFSVQVDVWAADLGALDQAKQLLDAMLLKNGWAHYSGALDKDPDIDLYRLARRYRTTQKIKFI